MEKEESKSKTEINLNDNKIASQSQKLNKPISKRRKVVGFILVLFFAYLLNLAFSKPQPTQQDLINETVNRVKTETVLPQKADESTTMVDITAEPNAIRYHYVLSGVDPNNVTNEDLKNYLISPVCEDKPTKNLIILQGVNMEYSYIVKDDPKTFFFSIKKDDCVNYYNNKK